MMTIFSSLSNRSLINGIASLLTSALLMACAQPTAPVTPTAPSEPVKATVYPEPPLPGPAKQLRIAAPFEQTLANGLRVVVVPRHDVPLVSAQLIIRSGSELDPSRLAGLADLTATMLTKGSEAPGKPPMSATQIAQTAEALGSSLDGSAGWHRSSVAMTVATPKLAAALGLMADTALSPSFASGELLRVRAQALDGLRVSLSEPGVVARLAAQREAFGASAYGHPAGGTAASLQRIHRNDLQQFHRLVYRPDNAALVFAGDIDAAEAMRLASRYFGAWKKPATPLATSINTDLPTESQRLVIVDMAGAGQASVVLAAAAVNRASADYYAGLVANSVLGGGYSSRLNQEVRIKRGLSYGAGSSLDARRQGGLFIASTQTKNPSAAEVVGLMREQIAQMRTTLVTDEEIAARKAALIGGFSRSLETTAGLASQVSSLIVNGIAPAEITQLIDHINHVKASDIQNFASTHWRPTDLRIVVAGDAAQFGGSFKDSVIPVHTIALPAIDFDRPQLQATSQAKKR